MNKHRQLVLKASVQAALLGYFVVSVNMVSAQDEGYVPPPSGPYQPSAIVIQNPESEDIAESQVYRFPPSNILAPEPELRQYSETQREPVTEAMEMPAPAPMPMPNASLPPQTTPPLPQQTRPAGQWQQYPNYSSAAQQPYTGTQNWYGYQGGTWQQSAPGYGYYPYPNQEHYPQGYGQFDNMPSPWSVMPKNPFFSD